VIGIVGLPFTFKAGIGIRCPASDRFENTNQEESGKIVYYCTQFATESGENQGSPRADETLIGCFSPECLKQVLNPKPSP
jgi:hypothetical protein